jgi:hypothetical protein
MALSSTHVRRMLRAGDGTFWKTARRMLHLQTTLNLWLLVRDDCPVGFKSRLSVPREAFRRRALLYAYLAQGALSRGSKPCSKGYSAGLLQRSLKTVQRYRRVLRGVGVLVAHENFTKVRRYKPVMGVDFRPGEYLAGGHVCRRLPDTIELRKPDGELLDILVNPRMLPKAGEGQPRIYFRSPKEARAWVEAGLPLAEEPVVQLGAASQEWMNISDQDKPLPIHIRNSKVGSSTGQKCSPPWWKFSRQPQKVALPR